MVLQFHVHFESVEGTARAHVLLQPQPHEELLWPELHLENQKCSCSSPAAPRPCCHTALPTGVFEEHQCKLLTPQPGCSQRSLASPTEDPAVCHKSWKVSAFLLKSPVCGQKLKGSGSFLVIGEKENRTTTRTKEKFSLNL